MVNTERYHEEKLAKHLNMGENQRPAPARIRFAVKSRFYLASGGRLRPHCHPLYLPRLLPRTPLPVATCHLQVVTCKEQPCHVNAAHGASVYTRLTRCQRTKPKHVVTRRCYIATLPSHDCASPCEGSLQPLERLPTARSFKVLAIRRLTFYPLPGYRLRAARV